MDTQFIDEAPVGIAALDAVNVSDQVDDDSDEDIEDEDEDFAEDDGGAESHWDSLAAELGLADGAARASRSRRTKSKKDATSPRVKKSRETKSRTSSSRSDVTTKIADSDKTGSESTESSEAPNVLDELFVSSEGDQFEAPKSPRGTNRTESGDKDDVLQDEKFVEFEIEDFDSCRSNDSLSPSTSPSRTKSHQTS